MEKSFIAKSLVNNKDKRYLTKSRMKLGLECPKKLYYYEDYKSQDSDNEFLEILAEGGYQVGELAKYYYKFHFPYFINMNILNILLFVIFHHFFPL